MRPLPRSRTLSMLRSPVPFGLTGAVLGIVTLGAVLLSAAPDFFERTRLASALLAVSETRIDAVVEHAMRGHWPVARPLDAPVSSTSSTGDTGLLDRRITADGIAVVQTRERDRVELAATWSLSRGDTLAWRCRVRAVDGGRVAPLSLPASCRE